jgi:uncharacterized protein (TIGR00369 family)
VKAINAGLDGKLFNYLQKSIKETAYYKLLGIELQELAPGSAEFRVAAGQEHTNPMGLIHGGLMTSIVDAAMGNAVRSLGIKGVTADMSIALMAAARPGDTIIARGKVLKSGKNLIFTEALVYVGETLAGHSKATFFKISDIKY